ncbi:MAG: hypothetical protein H6708_31590 [Kofleriaceae bacterium]|nr:hypothetical protein [Myxococcales bacterium]MCB9564951.1 hypothetical protein [Kofleriaceae bacterium]
MGALDFMDSDHDGNIVDDGLRLGASALGNVMMGVGAAEGAIGTGLIGTGIAGAFGTGGLAGIPGGLLAAGGLALDGVGLATGLVGKAISSDVVGDAAMQLGDFLGGPAVAPGTPAATPSLADVLPEPAA